MVRRSTPQGSSGFIEEEQFLMHSEPNRISEKDRFHIAIIMDGSGRWATARDLPRQEGHRAGARTIREIVDAALLLPIRTLTLFAFSENNWERPATEVRGLMDLFENFFRSEREKWMRQGVRFSAMGHRDRLPGSLLQAIEESEMATCCGARLHLRIAIDYSSQSALIEAARRFHQAPSQTREEFSRLLAEVCHSNPDDQEIDLLIRTGGEYRLSDFLLWESAYAELLFSPKLWPDFNVADLEAAIREFRSRERRYGRLPATEMEPENVMQAISSFETAI
jgi:undecaprenyl diphosphate synthase